MGINFGSPLCSCRLKDLIGWLVDCEWEPQSKASKFLMAALGVIIHTITVSAEYLGCYYHKMQYMYVYEMQEH